MTQSFTITLPTGEPDYTLYSKINVWYMKDRRLYDDFKEFVSSIQLKTGETLYIVTRAKTQKEFDEIIYKEVFNLMLDNCVTSICKKPYTVIQCDNASNK